MNNSTAAAGGSGFNGNISSSVTDDYDDYEVNIGYRLPPPDIVEFVDGPPFPTPSFLERRPSIPLAELTRPEKKLAGIHIDAAECNSRNQMSFYTGIEVHQILNGSTLGPENNVTNVGNKENEEIAGNEESTGCDVWSEDKMELKDVVLGPCHESEYGCGYGCGYGYQSDYGSGYESG